MKENRFQAHLIKELKTRFPECIVLKTDPTYIQGIPDLLILFKNKWAALECKRTKNSKFRPNQKYYITKMNDMSFASAIFPENKKALLEKLDKFMNS